MLIKNWDDFPQKNGRTQPCCFLISIGEQSIKQARMHHCIILLYRHVCFVYIIYTIPFTSQACVSIQCMYYIAFYNLSKQGLVDLLHLVLFLHLNPVTANKWIHANAKMIVPPHLIFPVHGSSDYGYMNASGGSRQPGQVVSSFAQFNIRSTYKNGSLPDIRSVLK